MQRTGYLYPEPTKVGTPTLLAERRGLEYRVYAVTPLRPTTYHSQKGYLEPQLTHWITESLSY